MPLTTGLIIAGTAGLIKTGIGLFSHNSAANDLKNAKRPEYPIPKQWYDNVNIAGNMAQHGLTEPAMNYYTTQAGRGLSSSLGTTLEAGGNVNNISALYDQYDTGINKVAAEDSQLKNESIKNFIEANGNLGNEYDKKWTLDQYEPYKDRVKADNQKMAAGTQTMFNGMSDIGNSITSYGMKDGYGESKAEPTMGDKLGQDVIATGTTPGISANSITPSSAASNPFSTPGGVAALKQMIASNPNSPYLKNLISQLS